MTAEIPSTGHDSQRQMCVNKSTFQIYSHHSSKSWKQQILLDYNLKVDINSMVDNLHITKQSKYQHRGTLKMLPIIYWRGLGLLNIMLNIQLQKDTKLYIGR